MDYPEILYQLDENKYYLFLTWLALLLAALAGNTRVLRSLLYSGVPLIVLGGLVLLLGLSTELVQVWVPGRHPRITDIVVDVAAGMLGWGLARAWSLWRARK